MALGDSVSAERWFGQSIGLAREVGLARGVTLNLLALGDLQLRRQALEEAAALYDQAWQRAQETGEMSLAADSLLRLANAHQQQGRYEDAARESRQALDIAAGIDSPYGVAEARYQLGELDRLQDRDRQAIEQYGAAQKALPAVPDPELAWRIHYGKGLALAQLGELQPAIAELQQAIGYIDGRARPAGGACSARGGLSEMDFRQLGLKVGIEIHQQLSVGKLFCDCSSEFSDEHHKEFLRHLRPTQSEMGEIDRAALEESERKMHFRYQTVPFSCLVEADEEPPHDANKRAIEASLEMSALLEMTPADEIHFMRKIVIDGSNTGGFQRTALVSTNGSLDVNGKKITIPTLCLEEDAARKMAERQEGRLQRPPEAPHPGTERTLQEEPG